MITYSYAFDKDLPKIKIEYEKYDDAFESVYGIKWDPFKYGDKCDNDVDSLQ